ncbi:uncharacterized protein LOC104450690 isoform X2 [Eucalyptus grandis]|uniref:uncharacterized protein LOC104450690 isoform X2 n=1 Tax=Eucalyptus grandis TaxID=71139 RepID=UPI00192E8E02|nr:uncharacterized protein LOC104450690 isoform X2 [Eucalyptus grandis]
MEAFSSAVFASRVPEARPVLGSPVCSIRPLPHQGIGCLRMPESCHLGGLRACALASPGFGEGAEDRPSENGIDLMPGDAVSPSQGDVGLSQHSAMNVDKTLENEMPLSVPYGSGTRAGLFRTPISGGVQSATSAHGLPRPALAVRNLMEQARFAHLCTVMSRMHHRREGYPFGSLVDFAPDPMGHPIFSFSPLAIHTRNLLADPKCSLVVQIPGWSSLSNARVTIFGDVYPLSVDQQEWAHKQYIAKHQQGPSQQWGNFYYFRMQNISDIYFIGGFGTVAWVDVKEYESLEPDKIAVDGGEQNLKELNALFSKPLKKLLSTESEVDDAALISIDSKGTDIRVRQGAQFFFCSLIYRGYHLMKGMLSKPWRKPRLPFGS